MPLNGFYAPGLETIPLPGVRLLQIRGLLNRAPQNVGTRTPEQNPGTPEPNPGTSELRNRVNRGTTSSYFANRTTAVPSKYASVISSID